MDTKLQAQIHAQEARTANATIAEIYRLRSGATGEPGNWHGAEPVRKKLAELTAELDREVDFSGALGREYFRAVHNVERSNRVALQNTPDVRPA